MDARQPPSYSASGGPSPNTEAAQQQQQQASQPTAEQQAAYEDLMRRFQSEAEAIGVIFPPSQWGFQPNPDALQSDSNAFQHNYSAPQGSVGGAMGGDPSTTLESGFEEHFEKVCGDIPIDKFAYGTADADWAQWSDRFEKAVQVATNACGRARLEELCLTWVSLKLNDEALIIYERCTHKETDWPLLKAELASGLEDPTARRKWARYPDAYKKPASMSLQVYRANIVGLVNRYSSALATDPTAYNIELYNRFVNGLEADWREYVEESIPYGKETLDNAYSQALKFEAKLAKRNTRSSGSAAAMTVSEKDTLEKIRLDLEKVKIQMAVESDSNSDSNSDSQEEEDYRSVYEEDDNRD